MLDLECLNDRRENLCLQFAKKCLRNQKELPMIKRFQENYEVENAHTSRLQNSPVVYMQRLLNET